MKLYEVSQELASALAVYEDEQNEDKLVELEKRLDELTLFLEDKGKQIAYWCMDLESDAEAISSEIERLKRRKDTKLNLAKRLKEYLKLQMETVNLKKIESPTLKISIQNNPASVVVDNESEVPELYHRVKTIVEIDKRAIMEAWKAGTVGVAGTHIEQKTRLVIK